MVSSEKKYELPENFIDDNEIIENNTDQSIDFKAQLDAFKGRTE